MTFLVYYTIMLLLISVNLFFAWWLGQGSILGPWPNLISAAIIAVIALRTALQEHCHPRRWLRDWKEWRRLR